MRNASRSGEAMRAHAAVLLLASSLPACHVGIGVDRFAPAQRPEGIAATLWLDGRRTLAGELLEASDAGLLLLSDRGPQADGGRPPAEGAPPKARVVSVPYAAIRKATFAQLFFEARGAWHPRRETLRRVSRFPQGLTPELRERLLAAHGQAAPEEMLP
jgi:hypothetical protein